MNKISEKFQTMNELRTEIESIRPYFAKDEYETVLFCCGLLENKGVSETIDLNGEKITIDKFLVPMIQELNAIGIPTLACCSGLQSEHMQDKFRPSSGYLSILYDESILKKLQHIIVDSIIQIEESDCYLKHAITFRIKSSNDNILKEKWCIILNAMKQAVKMSEE